jgi:hypothetical protein
MTVMGKVEVKLLADFLDGKPIYEMVPAEEVGPNRYRLSASPGFAPGIAGGDVIEVAPAERLGYRVLERSGNVSIQLFLHRCDPEEQAQIVSVMRSIGAWLDGGKDVMHGSGCLLIFTVPVAVGFGTIEQAMSRISLEFPVDKWMYGNVYETQDGTTPLNWWVRR